MPDTFTTEKRREIMSHVKNRNTAPEILVRRMLHHMGYRFRLNRKDLPGSPDIVLPRHKKVIFVHGCFWHGHEDCPRAARPSTNVDFWNAKIDKNMARDRQAYSALNDRGWAVLVVWQCTLRKPLNLEQSLRDFLDPQPVSASIAQPPAGNNTPS